jgi:hypothetical protein
MTQARRDQTDSTAAPLTPRLSGKPKAFATTLSPMPELALLSASVRRCTPAAVTVATKIRPRTLVVRRLQGII